MKRRAMGIDNDDSSDEEDEDDNMISVTDSLHVFCVASSDYMRLTQTNPDGPPMV